MYSFAYSKVPINLGIVMSVSETDGEYSDADAVKVNPIGYKNLPVPCWVESPMLRSPNPPRLANLDPCFKNVAAYRRRKSQPESEATKKSVILFVMFKMIFRISTRNLIP